MMKEASPRPWTYYNREGGVLGRHDWIEDAHGNIVVEHVGHIDGPLIVEAVNAASTPPDAGVRVKALDLSNLLKHAFICGYNAAAGDGGWTDYDPEDCPAYGRILAALFSPSPDASGREAPETERAILRVLDELPLSGGAVEFADIAKAVDEIRGIFERAALKGGA